MAKLDPIRLARAVRAAKSKPMARAGRLYRDRPDSQATLDKIVRTPKRPNKRERAAEAQAETGVFTTATPAEARAAKAAYESFIKEAGYDKDARVREWEKLSYVHQRRWLAIARAVLSA